MIDSDDIQPLTSAFPRLRGLIRGKRRIDDAPATLADVFEAAFDLDPFARDVLLLAAYAELEPEAARLIAKRQRDRARTTPTVGLALAVLPNAHWSAFAPDAPLRAEGLIHLGASDRLTGRTLTLPEPVLQALLGAPALGERMSELLRPIADEDYLMTDARGHLAERVSAAWSANPEVALQLCGPDPNGKLAAAASACQALCLVAYQLSGSALPATAAEAVELAHQARRDLRLCRGAVLLEWESAPEPRTAVAFAEALDAPLLLIGGESLALTHRASERLDMGRTRHAEQIALWQDQLGPLVKRFNGALGRIAGHFAPPPETLSQIAVGLAALAERDPDADLAASAWQACRAHARPRMDDLAQRIEARTTWKDAADAWADLVLPRQQVRVLEAIEVQIRHRALVHEAWGFDQGVSERGLGVSALFSGPSGSGKTLAAEALAKALALDLYRIDLSAVVSKWIGETEKNLRRVFDAAEEGSSILLFDEADSLFGKRSEVKDSHDRYANVEISYLLQRLEAYRGLAILTTNLRSHIDEAFLRRLRFTIDFPFPSAADRAEIWRRAFPKRTPTEGLDFGRLAQLNLVGGAIRNVALNAAFFAADRTAEVTMGCILDAARLEAEKAGRALTATELRGWPQ